MEEGNIQQLLVIGLIELNLVRFRPLRFAVVVVVVVVAVAFVAFNTIFVNVDVFALVCIPPGFLLRLLRFVLLAPSPLFRGRLSLVVA